MSELWFDRPAKVWEEALPLGNGRLGAMVFGGITGEHLALNEESVWYGCYRDRNNPDAKEQLPKIRQLILDGRIKEAERLIRLSMSGCPDSMRPYQSLGDLHLDMEDPGEVKEYRRSLDFGCALAQVSYVAGETKYTREYFTSAPENLLVMRLRAEGEGKINLTALLRRQLFFMGTRKVGNSAIALWGQIGDDGVRYDMQLSGRAKGGKLYTMGESLVVEDADEVLLLFCAATCFNHENPGLYVQKQIAAGLEKGFERLFWEHMVDYRGYFDRMSLKLGTDGVKKETQTGESENRECDAFQNGDAANASEGELPTDRLLESVKSGTLPTALVETYFDFGRYLLISCSRPDTLPATLQGLWNKDMLPPWGAKFTININTEMNYWPAETCNLSECHLALFDHIKRMVENGRKTARTMYGCRGFVAHHNTDIWGDTAVQDLWIPGSYWVMGAAWLCTHQWTHYQYTLDQDFLKEAFPIMREAALFFLDFMIEKDGYLVTCPSVSPENTFILPNGERGSNSAGVTMDNQILRDLFTQCIEAAKILGVDDELNEKIKSARERLRPTRIASNGTLMEWEEEYEEAEPGHRHISHLYGLHPSSQITVEDTPELAAAAEKTLARRLSMGGGHTGWSCAWIINMFARLQKGEDAYQNLKKLFTNSTLPNLFDNHPPFQIDGNFGATAAIVEMLVQARNGKVFLLPALPKAWPDGKLTGVCLPGNAEAVLEWKDGSVIRFAVLAKQDWSADVYGNGEVKRICAAAGEMAEWS